MQRRSSVVVVVVAASCVAGVVFAPAVRADISPGVLIAGPGLAPPDGAAAKALRMSREHVVIELHHTRDGAFAVVDATFWMTDVSTSVTTKKENKKQPATSLQITFPGDGVMVGGQYVTHPKLHGFRAFVDGKPVASKEDPKTFKTPAGPPGSGYTRSRIETWHVFPATIDDDTVIRVRYAVAADAVGNEEQHAYASLQYILHSGGPWAGTIGEAVIEVRAAKANGDSAVDLDKTSLRTMAMAPVSLVSLHSYGPPPPVLPAGAVRTKNAITWTQKELEPGDRDDVEVVFPSAGTWDRSPGLAARMEAAARG